MTRTASRRRAVVSAVVAGLLIAGTALVMTTTPVGALAHWATIAGAVPGDRATAGAVNVKKFGATGDGTGDDTAAFAAAMAAASEPGAVRYPEGPTGAPQGVVFVPAGTYRLLNLTFPSNMRMEVDAGAVFAQAGGRTATAPHGYALGPSLVLWDGPPGSPLRNVSLVGVGTSAGGLKSLADPVWPGWSIVTSFTFNLDPAATDASNLVSGLAVFNTRGFLVANVYSIQNDWQPKGTATTNAEWWPGSRKVALLLRARKDTPLDGSAFYDPTDGVIANWYNIRGPRGWGLDQVQSGHALTFLHLFSQGGTTLRLETDASQNKPFGSELRGIRADDITGLDCNRAVSFAPHHQQNYDVQVTDVTAVDCYQGVVESKDEGSMAAKRGSFQNSSIARVTVIGGNGAQLPVAGANGGWTTGISWQAFGHDRNMDWAVVYQAGTYSCTGVFQKPSPKILTTEGLVKPPCPNLAEGTAQP